MKNQNSKFEVITHGINGFENDSEFIEIEGEKYQVDPEDNTKPLLDDDGNKVKFEKKDDGDPEDKKDKGGDKTIDQLAEENPAIKALLDEVNGLRTEKTAAEKAAAKAAEEAAEKNGEWKSLAESYKTERDNLQAQLEQKETQLGKYVGSVKQILKEVMETIPADKRGLVPDNFSAREKLEYITKNAKLLGANVSKKNNGGVPPNDEAPLTDEAKLVSEIAELQKKENKTSVDHDKLFELSKKLKEIRAAK